jgi:hypothetical protein
MHDDTKEQIIFLGIPVDNLKKELIYVWFLTTVWVCVLIMKYINVPEKTHLEGSVFLKVFLIKCKDYSHCTFSFAHIKCDKIKKWV